MFYLVKEMVRCGYVSLPRGLQLAVGHVRYRATRQEHHSTIDRARDTSLAAIRGRPRDELVGLSAQIVHEHLVPRVYSTIIVLIEQHRLAGDEIYLATSSAEELAQPMARELGMDGAMGTRVEVEAGIYTRRLRSPLNHGEAKAARIVNTARGRRLDLSRSTAYSDSIHDLPMLELVGHPVAVNPDRRLRALARSRDWRIIETEARRLDKASLR